MHWHGDIPSEEMSCGRKQIEYEEILDVGIENEDVEMISAGQIAISDTEEYEVDEEVLAMISAIQSQAEVIEELVALEIILTEAACM